MNWTHAPPYSKDLKKSQEAHLGALSKIGYNSLPTNAEMLRLYKTMLAIRTFENRAWEAAKTGEGLSIHPSTGHEAVAAGVISLLRTQDKVVSNHRPLGHFIAKGGSLDKIMAELFGKRTGINRGIGGELFWSEPSIGFTVSSMIIGAGVSIATGVGLALKIKKSESIATCFFGDAATTNAAFHEGITMASLYQVPVLYVCENNGYSTNSPAIEYMPKGTISNRVAAYEIPTITVDGSDVLAVRQAAIDGISYIRQTRSPYFIEALVQRIGAHKQELIDSRTEDRVSYAKMKDPLELFERSLLEWGVLNQETCLKMRNRAKKAVDHAVEFARKSTPLTLNELSQYVYAEEYKI